MPADGSREHAGDTTRRTRFERIYTATYDQVLSYALRRTEAPDDAADVVAETFLVAWRRLEQLSDEHLALPWLYGIARRVLANHYRGERRDQRLATHLRAMGSRLAEQPQDPAEAGLATAIVRAYGRLKEADREILALVGWERLTSGEVAAALGCPVGLARVRLHRARKRFAKELKAEGVSTEMPRHTRT